MSGGNYLCLTTSVKSKAMLEVGENFVVLNMVQNVSANNMFKEFAGNTSQRLACSFRLDFCCFSCSNYVFKIVNTLINN